MNQLKARQLLVDGSAQHTATKRSKHPLPEYWDGLDQAFSRSRPDQRGIHDGVDYLHSGDGPAHRRKRCAGILEQDAIALISPLGSPQNTQHLLMTKTTAGELFSVSASEVAEHVAVAIEADKLIFLDRHEGLADGDGSLIRQSTIASAEALALADDEQRRLRDAAPVAVFCAQAIGVARSASHGVRVTDAREGSQGEAGTVAVARRAVHARRFRHAYRSKSLRAGARRRKSPSRS